MTLQQIDQGGLSIHYSKDDWLEDIGTNSIKSKETAKYSIRMFELYFEYEGINPDSEIKKWQVWAIENDLRSVCLSLNKFIHFLNKNHDDIELNKKCKNARVKFKKKNAKTIKTYFSFVKTYLRVCHGIRITKEDVKDFMKAFPKIKKERRRPITIQVLKLIFSKAEPKQKALYSVLISSGMRLGEAIHLRKKDFHLNENPVRITLLADFTKEKEERETFISREAVDKLLPFIENKKDDDNVFAYYPEDLAESTIHEDQYFGRLRERLGLIERYHNSRNFIYSIHSMRAYFSTKASDKHGEEYAHALDGHTGYLKQYYRKTPEEMAKMYKELEPGLLVESFNLKAEENKDKVIDELKAQVEKIKEQMNRMGDIKQTL